MSWRVSEAAEGRYYNSDGCPVDRFGNHEPHRLNMATFMRHRGFALAVGEAFRRRVPESRVEEDVQDGVYLAQIECVCGEEPIVELSAMQVCACERIFYYAGAPGQRGRRTVFVGNSPLDREPQTSAGS